MGRDCAVLMCDVSMSGEDGLTICRRVRARGDGPILMLTAARDRVERVVELERDANDYLMKAFDQRELRVRIQAVSRRIGRMRESQPQQVSSRAEHVHFGGLLFDPHAPGLSPPDSTELRITARPSELRAASTRSPNRLPSPEKLLDAAGSHDSERPDRSIDVGVARDRSKIEADAANPQMIRAVRSGGQIFVPSKP